jgi:glycosyltransferase involved in cell wall biosynthesis
MKKIGIDARFYGEAGPGRYAKAITQHLEKIDHQNKYYVFLRKKGYESYHPQNPNFTKVLAHHSWYSFDEQIFFLIKLLRYRLDLFYVPHFNIPVLYPGKLVTAIPDIIMHVYSTEKGTTLPKFYFKIKKLVYKLVVLWALIRSKKVIVPSNDTLNDFIKTYPYIDKNKFVLAREGVDPVFMEVSSGHNTEDILNRFDIEKPFLLYISSFYEHKNVDRLIEAFIKLTEYHGFKGQLVMVGKKDKFSESVYDEIKKHGLESRIIIPGRKRYVTDEEIRALRTEAELYVFPSLKEGFSLTPMEAQVSGLACVISDIPVHREIYGDSVTYFDPYNINDMAEKINTILNNKDLKNDLIDKGKNWYKKYSWDETAKITFDVFKSVL